MSSSNAAAVRAASISITDVRRRSNKSAEAARRQNIVSVIVVRRCLDAVGAQPVEGRCPVVHIREPTVKGPRRRDMPNISSMEPRRVKVLVDAKGSPMSWLKARAM